MPPEKPSSELAPDAFDSVLGFDSDSYWNTWIENGLRGISADDKMYMSPEIEYEKVRKNLFYADGSLVDEADSFALERLLLETVQAADWKTSEAVLERLDTDDPNAGRLALRYALRKRDYALVDRICAWGVPYPSEVMLNECRDPERIAAMLWGCRQNSQEQWPNNFFDGLVDCLGTGSPTLIRTYLDFFKACSDTPYDPELLGSLAEAPTSLPLEMYLGSKPEHQSDPATRRSLGMALFKVYRSYQHTTTSESDAECLPPYPGLPDADANNAPMSAKNSRAERKKKVRLLLAAGADVNLPSEKNESILVRIWRHPDAAWLIKLLLAHGLELERPCLSPFGTPILFNAAMQKPSAAKMLLKLGMNSEPLLQDVTWLHSWDRNAGLLDHIPWTEASLDAFILRLLDSPDSLGKDDSLATLLTWKGLSEPLRLAVKTALG